MKKIVFTALLALSTSATFANEHSWSAPFTPKNVSASLSSGMLLKSEANEVVYIPDDRSKASELNWNTNNAQIVNAEINWQFHPKVSFNARGWTTLSKNSSVMDDYDWMSEKDRDLLTDWSHHDNTNLNYANEFDLNFNFNIFDTTHYSLGAILGYQQNRYSWSAFGGTYHYSDVDADGNYLDGSALTDIGEFDANTQLIGYQQKFKMPYIGLSNNFKYNKFQINTTLKYSNQVSASDFDRHYSRDTNFYNSAKNGEYFGAILNASYDIRPDTKLFTEYTWSEYKLVKADTTIIDFDEGETDFSPNGGGISNKSQSISLGVRYSF